MAEIINHTYRLKRGTAQRWIEVNPILQQGEPGFEYDTNKLKIGDGFTPWNSLPYIATGENNNTPIESKEEIYVVNTFAELPIPGDATLLYRVVNDKLLYQWDSNTKKYEPLGNEGTLDPSIITLINGGNANG